MTIRIENGAEAVTEEPRSPWAAMLRGRRGRCPACGNGAMFTAYLKVSDACATCRAELRHQRADDAPPYFTMVIVAHVVVGGMLMVERAYSPPSLVHMLIWIPLTIGLSLWLLPQVKGALVGLQWALRMHGFGSAPDPAAPDALDSETVKLAKPQHERGR